MWASTCVVTHVPVEVLQYGRQFGFESLVLSHWLESLVLNHWLESLVVSH